VNRRFLIFALGSVDTREQILEVMPVVESIGALEPLTQHRQIMLGQQANGHDPLRTVCAVHPVFPLFDAKLLVRLAG